MTKPPQVPMHLDLDEPEFVRDLLQAGIDAPVEYDWKAGLVRHQGHIAAGTQAPTWADAAGVGGTLTGGGAATGGAGLGSVAAWGAATVVTLGLVAYGVTEMFSDGPGAQGTTRLTPVEIPATVAAPVVVAPAGETTPQPAPGVSGAVRRPASSADQVAASGAGQATGTQASGKRRERLSLRRRAERQERRAGDVRASASATKRAGLARASTGAAKAAGPMRAANAEANVPTTRNGADAVQDDLVRAVLEDTHQARRAAAEAAGAQVGGSAQAAAPVAAAEDPHVRWSRGAMADEGASVDHGAQLAREMRLLKAAQASLGSNPARAMRLARQGQRDFPGSTFAQEREHILILSLVELGRVDQAKRLAGPYLARYPRGPFSDRVRKALAQSAAR